MNEKVFLSAAGFSGCVLNWLSFDYNFSQLQGIRTAHQIDNSTRVQQTCFWVAVLKPHSKQRSKKTVTLDMQSNSEFEWPSWVMKSRHTYVTLS